MVKKFKKMVCTVALEVHRASHDHLDFVYVSPAWEARDGTPYSVGRIMEFLTPEGTAKSNGKDTENFTRVRIAWFYRPGDVSDRQITDSRLLLAAIFSEIMPITCMRARCYVKHRDKIADLAAWKKRPDRFYFHRLFDPYIKKEFEVILASDITNCEFRRTCVVSKLNPTSGTVSAVAHQGSIMLTL